MPSPGALPHQECLKTDHFFEGWLTYELKIWKPLGINILKVNLSVVLWFAFGASLGFGGSHHFGAQIGDCFVVYLDPSFEGLFGGAFPGCSPPSGMPQNWPFLWRVIDLWIGNVEALGNYHFEAQIEGCFVDCLDPSFGLCLGMPSLGALPHQECLKTDHFFEGWLTYELEMLKPLETTILKPNLSVALWSVWEPLLDLLAATILKLKLGVVLWFIWILLLELCLGMPSPGALPHQGCLKTDHFFEGWLTYELKILKPLGTNILKVNSSVVLCFVVKSSWTFVASHHFEAQIGVVLCASWILLLGPCLGMPSPSALPHQECLKTDHFFEGWFTCELKILKPLETTILKLHLGLVLCASWILLLGLCLAMPSPGALPHQECLKIDHFLEGCLTYELKIWKPLGINILKVNLSVVLRFAFGASLGFGGSHHFGAQIGDCFVVYLDPSFEGLFGGAFPGCSPPSGMPQNWPFLWRVIDLWIGNVEALGNYHFQAQIGDCFVDCLDPSFGLCLGMPSPGALPHQGCLKTDHFFEGWLTYKLEMLKPLETTILKPNLSVALWSVWEPLLDLLAATILKLKLGVVLWFIWILLLGLCLGMPSPGALPHQGCLKTDHFFEGWLTYELKILKPLGTNILKVNSSVVLCFVVKSSWTFVASHHFEAQIGGCFVC